MSEELTLECDDVAGDVIVIYGDLVDGATFYIYERGWCAGTVFLGPDRVRKLLEYFAPDIIGSPGRSEIKKLKAENSMLREQLAIATAAKCNAERACVDGMRVAVRLQDRVDDLEDEVRLRTCSCGDSSCTPHESTEVRDDE